MTYEIVEAKPWHVGQLARNLRFEHRALLLVMGLDPHRELRAIYQSSLVRKACILNGKVAALWGITGTLASGAGFVWLAISNDAARLPIPLIRETRKQLAELMRGRTELITTILADDAAARRFAILLGFHVEDGDESKGRTARLKMNEKMSRPEFQIPIGETALIKMGFHPGH